MPSPIPVALQIPGPDGAVLHPAFFLSHPLSRLRELRHKWPGFPCRHTPFSGSLLGFFPFFLSNPGLPHCRQILYQLNHKGSPNSCQSSPRIPSLPLFVTFVNKPMTFIETSKSWPHYMQSQKGRDIPEFCTEIR